MVYIPWPKKDGRKPFQASFLDLLKQNEQLRAAATAPVVAAK
ncbi:hypothetical protein ACTID9_28205 [Brevibacillus fluminis]